MSEELNNKRAPYELRNLLILAGIFCNYMATKFQFFQISVLASQNFRGEPPGTQSILDSIPFGIWMAMDMVLAIPYGLVMQHYGRKPCLISSTAIGIVGYLLAFGAMWSESYIFLVLSAIVISPLGMAEYTRFAAAEVASEGEAGKAVAMVLTYGALISSLGPLVASFFGEVVDPSDPPKAYAWDMLFCVGTTACAFAASWFLKLPPHQKEPIPPCNEWCGILFTRNVFVAAAAQWTVMFCMLLPMIGIVLQMQAALNLDQSANIETSSVITVHVIGMFATGLLTRRVLPVFGFMFTILFGFGLQAVGNILFLTIPEGDLWNYYVGNFFVGAGWNFAHVTGSVMVLQAATEPAHAFLIQSFSEFVRFSAQILGTLLANTFQWNVIQWICIGVEICSSIGIVIHFVTLPGATGFRRFVPVNKRMSEYLSTHSYFDAVSMNSLQDVVPCCMAAQADQ